MEYIECSRKDVTPYYDHHFEITNKDVLMRNSDKEVFEVMVFEEGEEIPYGESGYTHAGALRHRDSLIEQNYDDIRVTDKICVAEYHFNFTD